MSWSNFIHGDAKAFESIYQQYIDDLFAFGLKFHADREIVLDCIHDLFLDLYDNPRIAKDVEVKYYLFSALRRRILKRKKADVYEPLESLPENVWAIGSHELDLILKENQDINVQKVKQEIDKLPKRQKEVLYLKYYMEFSYEEIASIMNVSVESCRTLSYRAFRVLKSHMGPLEYMSALIYIFLK